MRYPHRPPPLRRVVRRVEWKGNLACLNMNRENKITNMIKRILNSKDGRVLVSNFGYLSLLQIAGYIFPLITMPYLARVIGADGFGKIAFASK